MTTTKEELIEYIRNWVAADTQLKTLRSQIKQLNQKSILPMFVFPLKNL